MKKQVTYEKLEERYGEKNYNRKCIDGRNVGCGNCVGYCMYHEHRGYLTSELRKQHQCTQKKCDYFIPKPKRIKETAETKNPFARVLDSMKQKQEEILKMACSLTRIYEGMSFVKSEVSTFGKCELSYVTISNDYSFDTIIDKIETATGYKVSLKKLNYSFETVAEIVMNKAFV